MQVNSINNTVFQSGKDSSIKRVLKKTTKSIDIKPIKNYVQYLKEYSSYIKK